MAHFDRGVYEPGDDVRVFDGSEDEEDVEGSRLPLLIVLALLVLAMFGGVVWLAYTQGVARGRSETPILTAQNGPVRVAPQDSGGNAQPYKGFKIYEQPAPADEAADATPPSANAKTDAVAPAPAVAPPPAAPIAASPAPSPLAPKPAPMAMQAAPAPKPVAKPAPAVKPEAKIAAAVPVKPAAPVTIGPATAPPRALAPATPAAPSLVAAPAPVSDGTYVLQIGAYKSETDAETAWTAYKGRHAALLAGAAHQVLKADLGDKGIWYRLRITGYSSKDVASATCDRLKADGGACLLGK